MTLLRQLVIVIVTLFLLLFAGTFAINVSNTRDYLVNQLETISRDTANSLGLTISQHLAEGDMKMVESMINAVFDSGYYREVVVEDMEGKRLIERIQPVSYVDVPQWFVDLVPLETPRGEALMMSGWVQAGRILVASNPGYAYGTLWSSSVDAFWWFLGSSLAVFGLAMVALHFILRPLREVEAQAKAICDRNYKTQDKLPWTLELRSVVEAMNRMTSKVQEMFAAQEAALERSQAEAYQDPTTGLKNRRYFDMQLKHYAGSDELFATGALLLVELKDFKQVNERRGYQAADELLRGAGQILEAQIKELGGEAHFAARLAGANLALVLADIGKDEVSAVAERVARGLAGLAASGLSDQADVAHVGVALYRGQGVGQLLAEADMALRAAQTAGPNAWHMHDPSVIDETGAYSATRWRELLEEVLQSRSILLHRQPTVPIAGGAPREYELLLRIQQPDGKPIPAGVFIPMAKRLGLIERFDRAVVEEVLERLAGDAGAERYVINLFPSTIADSGFVDWLSERLAAAGPAIAFRLRFELSESGAIEHMDDLRQWVARMRRSHVGLGLDHFGKAFASFGYLQGLPIDYIKIDGAFIRGIDSNRDNQSYVETLADFAHARDIQVVAESVETQAEWEMLKKLRVDAVQGYGVGQPVQWA